MRDEATAVKLVHLYRDALAGLAASRGLVASYEQRAASVKAELLRAGFITNEQLPELRLQVVPLPIEAQKMIDEARASAGVIAERKQQEAIVAAEQILAKAREASALEHERTMSQLKRELGRLVIDTTAKVTGKVLTRDDQRRLQEEASRQVAS